MSLYSQLAAYGYFGLVCSVEAHSNKAGPHDPNYKLVVADLLIARLIVVEQHCFRLGVGLLRRDAQRSLTSLHRGFFEITFEQHL